MECELGKIFAMLLFKGVLVFIYPGIRVVIDIAYDLFGSVLHVFGRIFSFLMQIFCFV